MLVTLDGIVTDVSPLHTENAKDPMLVTEDGIVTDVSPLQPENAQFPMLVTLSGIVIDISASRPSKAPSAISRTPEGNTTDGGQVPLTVNTQSSLMITPLPSPPHPENA